MRFVSSIMPRRVGSAQLNVLLNGSHYFYIVSCPLSRDPPRGWGCSVQGESRSTSHTTLPAPQVASPHKVFVTFKVGKKRNKTHFLSLALTLTCTLSPNQFRTTMHSFPSNVYGSTIIQVLYYTAHAHAQCMLHPELSRSAFKL